MAYNVLFRIYSQGTGRARINVDVKNTTVGDSTAESLWYGTGTLSDDEGDPVSFPWDSQNQALASGAPAAAEAGITKNTSASSDTATGNITLAYDRTAGTITLSSAAGLFATPVEYDVSGLEWSAAEANSAYAQLNAGGELSYEAVDQYAAPVITGVTNTAAQQLTVAWTASASSKTGANPTLTLQYSTDPSFSGAQTKSLTGLSGPTAVASLTKATGYYFRIQATWSTAGVTLYSNTASGKTITPLGTPTINSLEAASGSGTAGWNAIDGADGYQWRSASTEAGLSSATGSSSGISGTTLTFSGQSGKWIQVRAIAPSGQYATENSEWSEPREIPAATISYNETRIDFAAIPSVNVDSDQIHLDNDVVTKKYADEHYASTSSVSVSSLPKASGTGSSNAGIIYLENANKGLTVSSGKLSVNFASYDSSKTAAVNLTEQYKSVNPKYLGDYLTNNATVASAGSGDAGKLVKLDSDGLIDATALPSLKISETYTAASENAMTALSQANAGDMCIRTDTNRVYVLSSNANNAYATASNWKEITLPSATVVSVNGHNGTVTQSDLGLETSSLSTSNDSVFPSSKLVATYVGGQFTAKTSSSGVADGESKLVTGDQVYDYIAGLNLSTTYAAKSHTHTAASDISSCFNTNHFTTSSSKIVLKAAGASTLGGVMITTGNGLTYNTTTGALSMAVATSNTPGAVKAGTGLTNSSGTLSVSLLTSSYGATDMVLATAADDKAITPKAVVKYVASQIPSGILTESKYDIIAMQLASSSDGYITTNYLEDSEALTLDLDAVAQGLNLSNYLTASDVTAMSYLNNEAVGVAVFSPSGSYSNGSFVYNGGKVYQAVYNGSFSGSTSGAPGTAGAANYWQPVTLDAVSRWEGTITGDGSTASFTKTHNLGVQDVAVTLIDNSTNKEVFAAVTHLSATQVQIGFGAAPASGKVYRVIVRK